MEEFWDVIIKGIFGSIGFGFIGFSIALVTLFILKSRGVLKRTRKRSKLLVITYWMFIPIIFGCGFTALKALYYAENKSIEAANATIEVFEEKTFPSFHKYVTENVAKYTDETIIPTNEELVEKYSNSTDDEPSWITKQVILFSLELAEEQAEKAIANELETDQETVHAARLLSANSLDDIYHGGFNQLNTMSESYISTFFFPYYFIILGYWLLLLVFPITENILATRNRKKARAKAVSDMADL